MGSTGAPWNIPFVEPTDIPRTYPEDSEDLALAIAAGLSAAGGLVAVKHVLKTDTFTASSIAAGANVAVTGLSITHEVADPTNRLIISAMFGVAAASLNRANVGIAVNEFDGSTNTLLAIGDADGSRTRVTAGGMTSPSVEAQTVATLAVTFVHTPGAGSKTYTVHAINVDSGSATLFVNRSSNDTNAEFITRGVSSLVIQEVKV